VPAGKHLGAFLAADIEMAENLLHLLERGLGAGPIDAVGGRDELPWGRPWPKIGARRPARGRGKGMETSMSGRLDGKVAVITGGASGMGLATAARFLKEGAKVVIADLNQATGSAALESLAEGGQDDRVRFIRVDVAAETDIEAMIALAIDQFGRLDVLFNNAGVGGAFGALTDIHVDDWNYTFAVLVRGVFLGLKHGARQMLAQGGGGSIINTASIAGMSGGAGPLAYSAAKAAVINLTRASAVELARDRVRVNAICPGPILTPLMHGGKPDRATETIKAFIPWPEIGQPADIAGAALFFASDDSGFVTGDAMVVDGGVEAAGPGIFGRSNFALTPPGLTGANRGTTGEGAIVRNRPPRAD
jgi:NAD(P)-dependent dehydrogenase (short-subunit alcohol dehydrogenase family)